VVNRIFNKEILCAQAQGLKVLYCIGETAEEQTDLERILDAQIEIGLKGVDVKNIVIGYEPVWAIGPGKTSPDTAYIQRIARFIKEKTDGIPVVYGGGLKHDNAAMLASIPEVDGGLIGLTSFSGDIGFYPDECVEIIKLYLGGFK
jgi:triosephosphate isomerase